MGVDADLSVDLYWRICQRKLFEQISGAVNKSVVNRFRHSPGEIPDIPVKFPKPFREAQISINDMIIEKKDHRTRSMQSIAVEDERWERNASFAWFLR